MPNARWTVVVALALVGKLALAAQWELLADEAYHWTWAKEPSLGYYDQPPLVAWVLAAERLLFGDVAVGLRAGGVVAWVAAAAALAPLARDRGLWWLWALGLPPLAILTNLAVPDALLLAAWGLGLSAAARGGPVGWALAGLCGGLASLAKYTGIGLLPLLLVGATPEERRTPWPWLGLGLAVASLAPNLWWNAQHGFVTFGFVVEEGLWNRRPPGFLGVVTQVVDQALVVGPVAWLAAVAAFVYPGKERVDRLAWATSAPLLVGFALAALGGRPEAHWPAPAWVSAGLLVARSSGRIRRAGEVGAGLGAVATGLLVTHSLHPLASWPGDPGVRLTEGRILAEEVERWAAPVGNRGSVPVFAERYQEAALIEWHTGRSARVFPGCGRPSQDTLREEALPAELLFVRPLRSGPPTCALARCEPGDPPQPIRRQDGFGRRVGPWDVTALEGCR